MFRTCNWCQRKDGVESVEGYGFLCGGCEYCVGHGAPRPLEPDQPFTADQRRLEAYTRNLFDQINKLYPKPQEAV